MRPYIYGPKFMWNLDCPSARADHSISADVSFLQWYTRSPRTFT